MTSAPTAAGSRGAAASAPAVVGGFGGMSSLLSRWG